MGRHPQGEITTLLIDDPYLKLYRLRKERGIVVDRTRFMQFPRKKCDDWKREFFAGSERIINEESERHNKIEARIEKAIEFRKVTRRTTPFIARLFNLGSARLSRVFDACGI